MAEILLRNSIYIREFNSRTNIILDIVLDSNCDGSGVYVFTLVSQNSYFPTHSEQTHNL